MHNKIISLAPKIDKQGDVLCELHEDGRIILQNLSEKDQILDIIANQKDSDLARSDYGMLFCNNANLLKGEAIFFSGLTNEVPLNARMFHAAGEFSQLALTLKLKPNTHVEFLRMECELLQSKHSEENKSDSDILVISPGYPNSGHLYNFGFVHTSAKAYTDASFKVDVFSRNNHGFPYIYEYDGMKVIVNSDIYLKNLIHQSSYKYIFVHFIDPVIGDILQSTALYYGIKIFVIVHGAEVMHHDQKAIHTSYQGKFVPFANARECELRDAMYQNLSSSENIHWIFVSNFLKQEAENLLKIEFKNSYIIPNGINTDIFQYQAKQAEDRLRIFTVRPFRNINQYSIDLIIKTINKLSCEDFFDKLQFDIYGDGPMFHEFSSQLSFKNVRFIRGFLTQAQIGELHKEYGIIFHPSRWDSMGVSSLEGVASGLVLVSSNVAAIPEFIDHKYGTLSDKIEDPNSYAQIIKKLYHDPDLFLRLSAEMSQYIHNSYSRKITLAEELKLLKEVGLDFAYPEAKKLNISEEKKLLSICIPVYNIAKFLPRCLNSILSCEYRNYLEIVIVNDGSKDETGSIAQDYSTQFPDIIKCINKENGGHGSAVICGLENSTGLYYRVIDGDDWVLPQALDDLILYLSISDVDMVLTDYCFDRLYQADIELSDIYHNIPIAKRINFDDIKFTGLFPHILATSTYRRDLLDITKLQLPHKCSYVDMEYNAKAIININNIVYLDLPIYRYFIGRPDQSISASSFGTKFKDHEKVIVNILKFLHNKNLSPKKKKIILAKLLSPMLISHLMLLSRLDYRPLQEVAQFLKIIFKISRLYDLFYVFLICIQFLTNLAQQKLVQILYFCLRVLPYKLGIKTKRLLHKYGIHFLDPYAGMVKKMLDTPYFTFKKWRHHSRNFWRRK
jgi:glycosyltransferase involved in cell wall biosynthesis